MHKTWQSNTWHITSSVSKITAKIKTDINGERKKRRVQTSRIYLRKQHRLYWNLNKELEIAFSCVVSEFRCLVGLAGRLVGQKTPRTRLSTKVVWNAVISYNLISLCEILLIQFTSFSFREKLFNSTTTTTKNFQFRWNEFFFINLWKWFCTQNQYINWSVNQKK